MAYHNFLIGNNVKRVMNAVAAGTTDQNSTGVDMTGYEEVTFIAAFGALTATQITSMKAQQSDDDGSADDYTDLAGTSTGPAADADSNKMLALGIYRPKKKWVRAVVDRGTANAVIDGIIAIRSRSRLEPVAQDASMSAMKYLNNPAEGTA